MNNDLGKGPIGYSHPKRKDADQKLHEVYADLYGEDLRIERGYELSSQAYQLRLAKAVLEKFKKEFSKLPVSFVVNIRGTVITYSGKKTKEEIIAKYDKIIF